MIAHLVADELDQRRPRSTSATRRPIHTRCWSKRCKPLWRKLRGTYGLAMVFRDWPDVIVAARLGSPLVIGVGDGEHFIASDASPLVGHTDKIVYLADNEIAVITADSIRVIHRDDGRRRAQREAARHRHDAGRAGQLSALHAQGDLRAARDGAATPCAAGSNRDEATAVFGGLNLTPQQLRSIDRIVLTACGTSWHAALVGEYMIEAFARIPVEVEYASELRYRNPPMSTATRCCSPSRKAAKRSTRSPRCAK